ncbi:hypothetical protein BZG35_06390 [Brevundimonas sp. LM2]|nr:hypothetical protein BZG35_06390 [Brevundimonas sp. LM2]
MVRIDGRSVLSRADFYAAIEQVAATPDWMGRNLDALFDVLVANWPKPTLLQWTHATVSAAAMGPDFDILLGVLRDAQSEPRSGFTVQVFDDPADPTEQTP